LQRPYASPNAFCATELFARAAFDIPRRFFSLTMLLLRCDPSYRRSESSIGFERL
jgi:hypothetical protein